jgi:hypothetical protein
MIQWLFGEKFGSEMEVVVHKQVVDHLIPNWVWNRRATLMIEYFQEPLVLLCKTSFNSYYLNKLNWSVSPIRYDFKSKLGKRLKFLNKVLYAWLVLKAIVCKKSF